MLAGLMLALVFLALLFGGLNVAQRLAQWGVGEVLTSTVETLQPAYTLVVIPTLQATGRVQSTATALPSATATPLTTGTSPAFATPTALLPESTPETVRIVAEDALLRVPLPNDAVIVLQPSSEIAPSRRTAGLRPVARRVFRRGGWERAILVPDRASRSAVADSGAAQHGSGSSRWPVSRACSAPRRQGVVRPHRRPGDFLQHAERRLPNDPVLPIGQARVEAYNAKCQNCLSDRPGADLVGVVIADPQADLRSLPTAASAVVGAAARDDRLSVAGRAADNGWLQVRTVALQLVWIDAAAVQIEGDLASAPLVEG
jgi:hypothetical protein